MMKEEHCFTENNTRKGHACERNRNYLDRSWDEWNRVSDGG